MPDSRKNNFFSSWTPFFKKLGSTWGNRFALFLIVAAFGSFVATYAALTDAPALSSDPGTVIWLLNLDLIIFLLLGLLVGRRIVNLWNSRKRGAVGAKLHARLVLVFGLLAATPAILMTVFAAVFLYFGVQSWFSERVSTAVAKSQAVAEAYLAEHMQVIRADALAMASDLNRQAWFLSNNAEAFNNFMETQSWVRNFSETMVVDGAGRIMAESGLNFTMALEDLPEDHFKQAAEGEVVLMTADSEDRVRALLKLDNFIDAYLFVGRMVDPVVLSHLSDTKQAVAQYEELEGQRSDLIIKATLMFVAVALLLLLAAMWFGLVFAQRMVGPIRTLISTTEKVREGDLTARVPEFNQGDEFNVLAAAFNRMTAQLQTQRRELIAANVQLDQRRRFTETVLAGVSAGIIGVDESGFIRLANSSACELFQNTSEDLTGRQIAEIIPEIADILRQAHQKPDKITMAELPFIRSDKSRRTLLFRIGIEMIGTIDKGAVLTFDDITELQSAQRKAAWADVARRIAHEIKNPLTPIQLSAERLKRKYLKQIETDADIFAQCTDTIIHHVGDIGRMVNEFSAFARMPEPVIKRHNIDLNLLEILVLQQQAHPDIAFTKTGFGEGLVKEADFDPQQLRQAVTNILQNAIDSVQARIAGKESEQGRIDIALTYLEDGEHLAISVTDNGLGLPENEDKAQLIEPYITHKEKGTGLGLAIVKKVMDDHRGDLILGAPQWLQDSRFWHDLDGASVSLVWPIEKPDEKKKRAEQEADEDHNTAAA